MLHGPCFDEISARNGSLKVSVYNGIQRGSYRAGGLQTKYYHEWFGDPSKIVINCARMPFGVTAL